MSSNKAKKAKASRNNAARTNRAKHPRLITGDMVTPAGNVPRAQANELADLLDPTARDLADMEYAMQLGNPEDHEPLIGCPLSIGGLVSSSVKVRTTQMVAFTANAAGDAFFVAYQHLKIHGDAAQTSGGAERIPTYNSFIGSEVNTCLLAAHSVAGGLSYTPDNTIFPGPASYGGVYVAPTGVQLDGSDARMVAQSFKVQPNSSALTTSGTGMMVRVPDVSFEVTGINNFAESSMALLSPVNAYALQNAERSSAALPNWDPDHWFSTNMLPKQIESVTFGECKPLDIVDTSVQRRALPGAGYAGFFAYGCTAGQTFVAEVTTIFEIKGSSFAYATPNPPQASELDVVSNVVGTTSPGVHSTIDLAAKGLHAAAAHATVSKGPSLGARFVSKFIKLVPAAKATWARLKGTMKGLFSGGGKIAAATLPLLLAAAPAMMKANRRAGSVRLSLGTIRPEGLPRHSLNRPTVSQLSEVTDAPVSKRSFPIGERPVKVLGQGDRPLQDGRGGNGLFHFLLEDYEGSKADLDGDFRVHHPGTCNKCNSGLYVLIHCRSGTKDRGSMWSADLRADKDAYQALVGTPGIAPFMALPGAGSCHSRDAEIAATGRTEYKVHWPELVGSTGRFTTFQCEGDCKMCLSGLVRVSGDELTFWCFDHEGIIGMNLQARGEHLAALRELTSLVTEKSEN